MAPPERNRSTCWCARPDGCERRSSATARSLGVTSWWSIVKLREAIRFSTCRIEGERAEDWAKLGERLSRIGFRELEDYDFSTPLGRRPRQPPVP